MLLWIRASRKDLSYAKRNKICNIQLNIFFYSNNGLLSCDAVWTCMQKPTLQRNVLPPPPTLKMESVCSSETLVPSYKTTWHHNPKEYYHLLAIRTSNLKYFFCCLDYFQTFNNELTNKLNMALHYQDWAATFLILKNHCWSLINMWYILSAYWFYFSSASFIRIHN